MPLLGDPHHSQLVASVAKLRTSLPESLKSVLVITAHWEESQATVSSSKAPPMYYDYGGFPPDAYKIQYPAPGSPELAARTQQLLREANISSTDDPTRGYDHGTFVPLKLLRPEADLPIVQLSLLSSLDPKAHLAIGKALAPLRDEGVLIVGSGSSFHNMKAFMSALRGGGNKIPSKDPSQVFDDYLTDAISNPTHTPEQRLQLLENWESALYARDAHPREEHLLPLMVALGAAQGARGESFSYEIGGLQASSFRWSD
ncbi:hypothetical protein WJX72_001085 [[Myrmecia] bisecta]|uniref:Extradiol ring-cleavage dioxygenase class III enzyme subunit B domain-containing protein n=1 Tax=[Myrmecia] bisecta TaxID=41462 RepID=A0AAW1PT30_9CHLO